MSVFVVSTPGNNATDPNITPEQTSVHSDYGSLLSSPLDNSNIWYDSRYLKNVVMKNNGTASGSIKFEFTSTPIPVNSGLQEIIKISHGLSYIPASYAFIDGDPNGSSYYRSLPTSEQDAYNEIYNYYITSTQLIYGYKLFYGPKDKTGVTQMLIYYIFANSGA